MLSSRGGRANVMAHALQYVAYNLGGDAAGLMRRDYEQWMRANTPPMIQLFVVVFLFFF